MLNPSAIPGYGDAITFPPPTGHPLDPRTDTDDTALEDVENELATNRAVVLDVIEHTLEQPDIADVLADFFVAGRRDVLGAVLLARIEPRITVLAMRELQQREAKGAEDYAAERYLQRTT